MDKTDILDVAETVQGKLEDVILAGILVGDSLEDELRLGRIGHRDYAKNALAALRVAHNELERIYGELTVGINAEFEKRKG